MSGPTLADLRTIVLRIALISHAPTQSWDLAPTKNGKGDRWRKKAHHVPTPHMGSHMPKGGDTKIPRGTDLERPRPEERSDWEASYQRKTPAYFVERLGTLPSPERIAELHAEAVAVLEAWKRRPLVKGQAPAKADPEWKRYIAECGRDSGELAREYGCTRRHINRLKAMDWSTPDERNDDEMKAKV